MKISLGTVQFGLNYGITNSAGMVSIDMVGQILNFAQQSGISVLDTAAAYGSSEEVLGQFDLSKFAVISKIPSMQHKNEEITELLDTSLSRLNLDVIDGMLLHDEQDAVSQGGQHLASLRSLKEQGLIKKIGASFYSPDIAMQVMDNECIDIIQIPSNILDARFFQAGVFEKAKEKGIEVHVRSVFLQGLLAVNNQLRPEKFKNHKDLIQYDSYCQENALSPVEAALFYLAQNEKIDFGVLGCTTVGQLEEIVLAYSKVAELNGLENRCLTSSDPILLNPSKW